MAAGVGSVMTGLGLGATAAADYLGAVAGSSYVVGSLFGAYGGRMTGEMMQNISAEVHDFAFLPVHGERKEHEESIEAVTDTRRLRVTIAISGWLLEKEEVITPWRVLKPSAEVFALRFELEALMNLGQSIDTMVSSAAYGYAQSAMIKRTVFAEMMSAMWPMAIVKVARVVDNPFSLAKTRADKAGVVLANLLIEKAQGERPVTLVGYSLGARVIWSCLTSLAERKAFGLVESAILIGSPTPSDVASWRVMRTAVSGRLVNVYSEKDLILAFLYRTSSIQYGVAGLMPVSGLLGVENVDVSETVNGHLKYRYLVGSILQKVGFEDVDKTEVAKEAEAFERIVEEEKKHGYVEQAGEVYAKAKGKGLGKELYNKYGKRIGKDGKQLSGKEVSDADADKQLYAMEKEVQQKTQTGLYQWAVEQLYLSRPSVPSTGDAPNPQGAATGATKTADKTADAATKSLYQRAKEATYLSRSGGVEGQHVAKDKLARAQTTTSSAVSTSYLATAAGYIPTGYLPGFGAAGKGTKALGDAGDQAGKLQKDAGKANKPRMKKIDSARKSIGDTAEHVLKRTESAQKKLAGATKDPSQAATDVKNKAQDNTRDPLTTMSRTASGAQKQVDDTAKEASDVAAGTRQAVEVAAKDPTGVAEKGQKQVGEFAETAQKAAGGVTSYIPSFGLRGSAKSIKPAPPKRLASGRSKSTMTVDKTSAGASKSPSTTKAHEKISAASKGTPDQKKAAGYSSYIPYFGSKAASPAQPKDGPNDTSQKTESADDDAEGISKDIAKEAESTADDAKEAPQEIAENIQPAGEGAQKAASDGTSTANDMVSEASESTAGPTSAPSNIGVTLSGAASSATETPSKAGASISNAAAGAQKYMPNSQGLGGDAGSKLGDVAGGAASGVTAGASSLGKSVGSAAQFVGGAQSKRGEMTQNASDAAGQAVDENIGSEEGDHGLDKEYDTTASRLLGERNTDKMIGGAISDVAISDAGKGVAGISRSETGKEKEATESSDDDNVYGDDEDNAVFEDSRSKQTTPQKHGADDPFVDDPDDDADSQSTIKVSQCHDSSSSRSSDAGDEDPEEEEEEEEEEEKEGKGYASTVAGAGKSVVGAGASAGAAGASGVAGGVGMLGRGFGFG